MPFNRLMPVTSHFPYLIKALTAAEERRGFCAPNPAVGAVIVKDGVILAVGLHWAAGQAHAEVDALNKLSSIQSAGATVYVTLEPCSHQGRTPPCVRLLIERKVATVYYGYKDPNPLVAGEGERQLRAAGIFCQHVPVAEINAFYRSYAYWTKTRLPLVTAKLALSLDGKTAGPEGKPIHISGPEAHIMTHQWRKRSDAILTTCQTIIKDDPQLNVRLETQVVGKPVYILDTHLKLPLTAKILSTAASVTLFHQIESDRQRRARLEAQGVRCVPISTKNAKLPLIAALRQIGSDGMHDLWVEAGGTCFQALLTENLIHSAFIYIGLKWLGPSAQAAFPGQVNLMQSATLVQWQALGKDGLCKLEFAESNIKS